MEDLREGDLDRLKAKSLTACGYPGKDPDAVAQTYPNRQVLTAGYGPQGQLADLQLQGGLPAGMSGGALYVDGLPERPVIGVLYLGGTGAATSRVIPVGKVLGRLRRLNPELAGRLRTVRAGDILDRPEDGDTQTRERRVLRDLLVALPAWSLVRERKAFVEAALDDHPAAANLIWDDEGFTVASNLVQRLQFFDAVPLPDGQHAVCGLLAEIRARGWDRNQEIGEKLSRLADAFGCGAQ